MMTLIFILIVIYAINGKQTGKLVDKVKNVDWNKITSSSLESIKTVSKKVGRSSCTTLLYFYYTLRDENTSLADKALLYGAILYIVSPFDLLPMKILGSLGILDDVVVAVFVTNKIGEKITPEIKAKAEETVNKWFGMPAAEPTE